MRLVIDASVAVKWFVEEEGHEAALAILQRGDECFAPDLMLPEVAGAFDKKIKAGSLGRNQAVEALTALQAHITMVAGSKLLEASLSIAYELTHPVADCIYMACAIELDATLVTADKIFLSKTSNRGYQGLVVELGHETETGAPSLSLTTADIGSIEKLAKEFRAVVQFVRSETGQSFGSGRLKIHDAHDMRPVYDSLVYARLSKQLNALSAVERYELQALCWLGQGYSGDDWGGLVARAQSLDPGDQSNTRYMISKLSYIADGIDRLKALARSGQKS